MKRRKKYGAIVSFEGNPWTYRRPLLAKDRWRVDRRDRGTNKVERVTLQAENYTDAVREVAEIAARERQLAEEAEKMPDLARQTDLPLSVALSRWVATLDVRAATAVGYRSTSENLAKLLGSDRLVRAVTFPEVERLFSEKWKDRSGRTKLFYRWFLLRFFDWAIDSGLATSNPARKVRIQRSWRRDVSRADKEAGQALTPDECRKLLAAAKEKTIIEYSRKRFGRDESIIAERKAPDYLWRFIYISLKTGLRRSNVLGSSVKVGKGGALAGKDEDGEPAKPPLQWGMLDLEKGILSIPGALMKNGEDLTVPICDELWSELKRLQKELGRVPAKSEPIVKVPAGADVRKSFDAALKRAGLGDREFRLHDCRHSFLSHLGLSVPEMPMAKLAGHLPATMTQRYGTHLGVEELRPWINKLPPLLRAEKKKKRVLTAK